MKPMRTKTTLLLGLALLLLLPPFFISNAHAEQEISLFDVPTYLGDRLGVTAFVGGLIGTLILLMMFMLPLLIIRRGKAGTLELIFGIAIVCTATALGWFPIYGIILIVLLIAGLNAKQIADIFSGK